MDYLRQIEVQFDVDIAFAWVQANWTFSIYSSAFYLLSIYLLQVYMRSHRRLVLRSVLSTWSFMLAAFSTVGAYHTMLYFIPKVWNDGLKSAACDEVFIRRQTGLWLFLFILSKLPELFDTYFIIFRKGPLIFLHWYHHITVFVYCWFVYSQRGVVGILFSSVNYFVHALMYTYYGLKAKQVTIPKMANICITSLQIMQMVFGMYMGIVMYMNYEELIPCGSSHLLTTLTLAMYLSYFFLFIHFFYGTYIGVKKKPTVLVQESLPPSSEKNHANRSGEMRMRNIQSRFVKYLNVLFYCLITIFVILTYFVTSKLYV